MRETACRLNDGGKNFDKATSNLARAEQVTVSGETFRVLAEVEGRRVLEAQQSGQLALEQSAAECRIDPKAATAPTRVSLSSEGAWYRW